MGFVPEHADVLRARFTKNIVGGPAGSMGPTGTPTAWGMVLALKEAASVTFGSPNLSGRTVAIQGLGAVGLPLAEYLLKEGADLIVTDMEPDRISSALSLAPDRIRSVPPEDIYETEADIFSPAAKGGILVPERIPRFKFKIIMGAANNQLKAVSQEKEIEMAGDLAKAGILFQIDWMHNPAGVIAGYEEYINQENGRTENIMPLLEKVCKEAVGENLRAAKEEGITPTERAYRIQEEKIYGLR
jgi:glutamate dehydrogenase/leucine dehydrogenase